MHRPRSPWTDCRLHIHIHEALRCLISGGFLCASTQAKECMPAGKGRRAACLPMYIHIHTHIHGGDDRHELWAQSSCQPREREHGPHGRSGVSKTSHPRRREMRWAETESTAGRICPCIITTHAGCQGPDVRLVTYMMVIYAHNHGYVRSNIIK